MKVRVTAFAAHRFHDEARNSAAAGSMFSIDSATASATSIPSTQADMMPPA